MNMVSSAEKDVKKIFSFWAGLEDKENGGFYGEVTFNLDVNKKADKGCILNSRILYFFSEYYRQFHSVKAKDLADHAFEFLKKGIDKDNGGIYWSLDYKGNPVDTTKHTYNIAFAIYALSSYYLAFQKNEALDLAINLYQVIETKCREKNTDLYYIEAQKIDFTPQINDKLSENGVVATRTMNTALHILEAYTNLYRVYKNPSLKKDLEDIMNLFFTKVYNPELNRLEVFFDSNYNSLIDLESYGHEIETSWLITEAGNVIHEDEYIAKANDLSKKLVQAVVERSYYPPFVINECEKGVKDLTRVWWVQAEAVNGFINIYQITLNKSYLNKAEEVLKGIEEYFIDQRENSEWFWDLDKDNKPSSEKDIVEPWKCPYHNGRMCFEVLRRLR